MTTSGFNGTSESGQAFANFIMTIARNKRHAARVVFGVENIQDTKEFIRIESLTDFHCNWVFHAAHKFHVGMINLTCSITNP